MITRVVAVGTPPLYVVANAITAPSIALTKLTNFQAFIPTSHNQRLSTLHLHRAGQSGRAHVGLFRPVTGQIAVGPRRFKDTLNRSQVVVCSVVHSGITKTRSRTRDQIQCLSLIGGDSFAPNGAPPCGNRHSELKFLDIAEQHRANCHESSAAKELTLLPAAEVSFVRAWTKSLCVFEG